MLHIDLSYEGRQLAERSQLDNGKLPHGGYRGMKRFPPSLFSYEKGEEFQEILQQEVERVLHEEELSKYGSSPSWSILLHKGPAYSDESPLMTYGHLASNKVEQSGAYDMFSRTSGTNKKCAPPIRHNGVLYYRPNRTHKYLSATELKDCAQGEVNIKYGRPTRTTLLRARQRSNSAPVLPYDTRREFLHRLDDLRNSGPVISSSEYLQLLSLCEGETLHSYLTGARYNRAHCLDAKSVDHSGVYMPKQNPALGCFFSGPKGVWYSKEPDDGQGKHGQGRVRHEEVKVKGSPLELPGHPVLPPPPPPRPTSAPSQQLSAPSTQFLKTSLSGKDQSSINKPGKKKSGHRRRNLDLNIVGRQLPVNGVKLPSLQSPRKSNNVQLEPVYKLDLTPSIDVIGKVRVPVMHFKDLTLGLQDMAAETGGADDRAFGVEGHGLRVAPAVSNVLTVPELDVMTEESPKLDDVTLEGDHGDINKGELSGDVEKGELSGDVEKVDNKDNEINSRGETEEEKKETERDEEGASKNEEVQDGGAVPAETKEAKEYNLNIETMTSADKDDEMTVTADKDNETPVTDGKDNETTVTADEANETTVTADEANETTVPADAEEGYEGWEAIHETEEHGQRDATDKISESPRDTTAETHAPGELPPDDVTFFLTEKRGIDESNDDNDIIMSADKEAS